MRSLRADPVPEDRILRVVRAATCVSSAPGLIVAAWAAGVGSVFTAYRARHQKPSVDPDQSLCGVRRAAANAIRASPEDVRIKS
jgi:hypothetical protein